jgi:ribosomal-protein-alanine N-acetyltransferase
MSAAPRFETARLRLRPYTAGDVGDLHRLWIDPEVRRYLRDGEVISRQQAASEVRDGIARFAAWGFGEWAVFPREEERLIGFCGFRFVAGTPEIELLYGLAADCWGQGLATEAARAVLRFGFEERRLSRITASADRPNAASVRVLEKLGMCFERCARRGELELVFYALTREAFLRTQLTG